MTQLSTRAESLFFAQPNLTAEEWEQRLTAEDLDGVPLTPRLRGELAVLIKSLGYFEGVHAREEPVSSARAGDSPQQVLSVVGGGGGHYDLIEPLGSGGHGMVYHARQRVPFERDCAVKVYYADASIADFPDGIREVETIRRLNHPGVCELLDAGITPWSQPFLVFQYVEGLPLHRHVQVFQAVFDERLRLFDEVLAVMAYAHGEGVVHRDLKPQNILIHRASGRAKVIDFGIARITEPGNDDARSAHTASGSGTREYQSPEQAGWIAGPVDARTDIHSLGCVLFEVLTGERAFSRKEAPQSGSHGEPLSSRTRQLEEVEDRLRSALLEQFPELSGEQHTALTRIISRCLQTRPEERFQTVAELRSHLQAVGRGRPMRIAPRGPKPWQSARAVVVSVAMLTVAIAGTGWVVLQARGRMQPAEPPPTAEPRDVLALGEPAEASLAVFRFIEKLAAGSPSSRANARQIISTRLLREAVTMLNDPSFAADSLGEQQRREAVLTDVRGELAFLDPGLRREVATVLVRRALEDERYSLCAMLATGLADQFDESPTDLSARSDMLAAALDERVVGGREEALRVAAEALVEVLAEKRLLATTPAGLRLVAGTGNLLVQAFGSEGRAKAEALLMPLTSEPEKLLDVEAAAAAEVLLAAMNLAIRSDDPERALSLADVAEGPCSQLPNEELLARWTLLKSEALANANRELP